LTSYIRTRQFFSDSKEEGKNVLLDLENNCVLVTKKFKSNDYFKYLSRSSSINEPITFFFQDGYIYSSKYPYKKIDSVKFDINSFEKTKKLIYTPLDYKVARMGFNNLVIIFALLVIVGLFIYVILKKLLKGKFESLSLINTIPNSNHTLFSNLEISFINELIVRSSKNGFCTTDEINNLLGVSQKSVEIQKKARTDFITKINQSFKEFKKTDEHFIIRDRSEKDKRSFNYSISVENQEFLKTIDK